MNQKTVK